MMVHVYNAWGREIASQPCRNSDDALSILSLYSQWDRAYIRSQTGRIIEMFIREV